MWILPAERHTDMVPAPVQDVGHRKGQGPTNPPDNHWHGREAGRWLHVDSRIDLL